MIYVASPYSHSNPKIMEKRYFQVMDYCVGLLGKGEFPYSPIVYGHEMANRYAMRTDAKFWEVFNFHMLQLSNCMHVCMFEGWKESKGVAGEIKEAERIGLPIIYV